ncbi:MAG: 2-hydroxyacid dehydrogenase [Candidatus Hodarchaeales archaeon]|jgi:lactate dehydrogenase-like 2-hydroxyacid dehydrogenase
MQVLFGVKFSSRLISLYREQLPDKIKILVPDDFSEEKLLELAPEIDIYINYEITQAFLEKATNLKHIQVPWTGSEKLDFDLLKEYPQITVSNSHSNSPVIAEHAVALLLAAAKRITYRDSRMRAGDWTPRYEPKNYSSMLSGKNLGVIGFGAIGQKVARILKTAFGMKIYAIRRKIRNDEVEKLCDYLGVFDDLKIVLKECDYFIISLPLTNATKGIIGRNEFQLMKKDAVIVNISRGHIIDEQALYEALKEEKVIAAIDTWYNYPENWVDFSKAQRNQKVHQNYPFEELDNIILSPHSAFKIEDIGNETSKDIIENILLISQGKNPKNQINLVDGY